MTTPVEQPAAPVRLASDAARLARALWIKIGRPEMCYPTPAQLVQFMREAPDDIAEGVAGRLLDDQQPAARCFLLHDGEAK